ncbi:hypothetical protein GN956_G17553 [Arapaima gigas]
MAERDAAPLPLPVPLEVRARLAELELELSEEVCVRVTAEQERAKPRAPHRSRDENPAHVAVSDTFL